MRVLAVLAARFSAGGGERSRRQVAGALKRGPLRYLLLANANCTSLGYAWVAPPTWVLWPSPAHRPARNECPCDFFVSTDLAMYPQFCWSLEKNLPHIVFHIELNKESPRLLRRNRDRKSVV